MLVHLLRELARELDGLDVRPEGAAEDTLEEGLDLLFDRPQHHARVRVPLRPSGLRAPGPNRYGGGGQPGGHGERRRRAPTAPRRRSRRAWRRRERPLPSVRERARTAARARRRRRRRPRRARPGWAAAARASEPGDVERVARTGDPEAERRRRSRRAEAPRAACRRRARRRGRRAPPARRDAARRGSVAAASGTRPSALSGARSGPSANRRPPRGSRQQQDEPGDRERAVEEARPNEMFPSGSTGTASAKASPARGREMRQRRGEHGERRAAQPCG